MATSRRRRYAGRRRYRYYRRYKNILSYEGMKAKVEQIATIRFPAAGQPDHVVFDVPGGGQPDNVATMYDVLRFSRFYTNIMSVFTYYKVLGAKMQITPTTFNYGQAAAGYTGQVYVGINYGVPNPVTVNNVMSLDSSVMLNPTGFAQVYSKAKGEEGRWHLVADQGTAMSGQFMVAGSADSQWGQAPVWNVRFIMYVAFKRNQL